MMTKEQLDALLARSILQAQRRMATLCGDMHMPVGANLFCRVVWPKLHTDEQYLLLGPNGETVIDISGLSAPAAKRIADFKQQFQLWWPMVEWHEQFAFVIRADVRVMKYANPSGLVLAQ